jgi:hypothetical protein
VLTRRRHSNDPVVAKCVVRPQCRPPTSGPHLATAPHPLLEVDADPQWRRQALPSLLHVVEPAVVPRCHFSRVKSRVRDSGRSHPTPQSQHRTAESQQTAEVSGPSVIDLRSMETTALIVAHRRHRPAARDLGELRAAESRQTERKREFVLAVKELHTKLKLRMVTDLNCSQSRGGVNQGCCRPSAARLILYQRMYTEHGPPVNLTKRTVLTDTAGTGDLVFHSFW